MAQDLLETANTYLLNATAQDTSNYAKNAVKTYQESYTSKGQSFNDLLTNANDRYASDANKYMTRDNRNTVNDKNTLNNNNKNSLDRNTSRDTNNVAQNSQTNRQDKLRDSRDNSRNTNDNNSLNSQNSTNDLKNSSNTNETNSTDKETTVSFEDSNNLDKANTVEISDELTAEDMEALNQMLLDDMTTEDETAEADVYINAYYQSTLDALNPVVDDGLTEETTTLNTLEDVVTEDVAETVALNTIDEANKVNVSSDDTEVKNNTLDDLDVKANSKNVGNEKDLKADTLQKEDANGKVTAEKDLQQDIIEDDKKVEVDIKTDETSMADDDVMVKATDDVVEQFKPVNAENQDGNKTSFKEVMEKAGLDEAKLEALNMTVTSNNSGTDLSNGFQSSAQDDIAKMAINGLNGKKDASEMHNGKEFSKLVDTKNMQQEEAKEISKNDILAQINNKMQAKNINGQQRITLQLTPESLGKITIELTKGKDGLQAKMLTDNTQVKDMLEKNIDGLKSTLASQGVSVNNVSVKVASASETASEFDFGRESFNQEQTQQDFAGTGERGGERDSQFANGNAPENAMNDLEMPTEGIETEMAMEDGVDLNPEAEKVAVGVGNVDIEV